MRRTMLASFLSALGLFSFVVSARAQDSASEVKPAVSIIDPARIAFDPEGSSRPVKAAATIQLVSSEGLSPSDQIKGTIEPIPSQRAEVAPGVNLSPSFQVPYAPGPSQGMTSMLRFMNCDPHSCPNIWQGYEAQRAAELAQKCAPVTSRCAAGCSCGGVCKGQCLLMPAPDCSVCDRPINRYRPKPLQVPSGCDTCDSSRSESATQNSSHATTNHSTAPGPIQGPPLPL